MDFLQQKMLIAALLGRNRVPGNMAWFALNRPAGEVRDRDAPTTHLGHLAVIQEEHPAGVIEQGGNIGGHKALFLSESDHNGRGVFGRQERFRVSLAQGNQGERTGKMPQGGPGRFTERESLLQVLVDQMGNDFSIRLRAEHPPFTYELVAQLKIVLDNAVVDDHHIAGAVRVGVLLGRRPMGRPAGVTDTDRAGQGVGL